MERTIVIDLSRLILSAEIVLERFKRDHPEHAERVTYTRDDREVLRDLFFNLFNNTLGTTTKYELPELEEDMYVKKIFKDYGSNSWYRDKDGEIVHEDEGSFRFESYWFNEMESFVDAQISKNRISDIGFSIISMDLSPTTITIEIWGDWRAQKWCEENNQEYNPT